MKLRKWLKSTLSFLFRTLTRLEVKGLENLPDEGGCILAVNHLSILDPPLVFSLLARDDAIAMIAKKYQRNPFFRWIIDCTQAIWVDREKPDYRALRTAVRYLRQGGMIGIAPEGTRSATGALMRPKPGVAYLAAKADVPIVPVAISGTENAIRMWFRLRRPAIRVEFGKPFTLPPLERTDREASLRRNTDEIMCQIARLLPPSYRGVYANHPRLSDGRASAKPHPAASSE